VKKHGKKWDAQRAYAGLGKLSSPHCDKFPMEKGFAIPCFISTEQSNGKWKKAAI
jgi:hypothetical protein